MSVPGEAMLARVKRTASVPYSGDDLDGVDDVALGLGHLFAVGVADEGVDVHVFEWDRFRKRARAAVGHGDVEHEVAAEHDHARDPEEEDVEAGDELGGGVEGGEVRGVVSALSVVHRFDSRVMSSEGMLFPPSCPLRTCSPGQPKTVKGSMPEENQVSRTSVDWVIGAARRWRRRWVCRGRR